MGKVGKVVLIPYAERAAGMACHSDHDIQS